MRIGLLVAGSAVVLMLVSCGRTEPEPSRESSLDPKQLVVRLADLPPRYSLVPGETIPIPLETVLADPWSTGLEAEIRRERLGGFQTSVWDPKHQRIQCSVAVYHSSTGARQILKQRRSRFNAFVAARLLGRPTSVGALVEDADAVRFDLGRMKGLAISWQHRNVIAVCSVLGRTPPPLAVLKAVVSAQQRRLATMLG